MKEYWASSPTDKNHHLEYFASLGKSQYLLKIFERIPATHKPETVLEIGCNVGRNLDFLRSVGYNVKGIEINSEAIKAGMKIFEFPNGTMIEGDAAHVLTKLPEFDVIFSMAALEHIEDEKIFEDIAKRARVILTIEDESTQSRIHYPRNYKDIFCNLGFKQVFYDIPSPRRNIVEKFFGDRKGRVRGFYQCMVTRVFIR